MPFYINGRLVPEGEDMVSETNDYLVDP
jgi:hypothetical protein